MFSVKNITSEQISLWIGQNFRGLIVAFSSFALIALAFVGWGQWIKKEEIKIQNSLYGFQQSLNKLTGEPKEKENPLDFLDKPKKKEKLVFNQEMKDKARLYDEAIRKNQKSRVAVSFAVDLANFYYQRDEKQKAKELLSFFALPNKSLDSYQLASFQLAGYYMDDRECEKAMPILSDLIKNKNAGFLHLEAELQSAICLEHLKRYNQALNKYESIINKEPEDYIGRLAQDYKRLLILKRRLKKDK